MKQFVFIILLLSQSLAHGEQCQIMFSVTGRSLQLGYVAALLSTCPTPKNKTKLTVLIDSKPSKQVTPKAKDLKEYKKAIDLAHDELRQLAKADQKKPCNHPLEVQLKGPKKLDHFQVCDHHQSRYVVEKLLLLAHHIYKKD